MESFIRILHLEDDPADAELVQSRLVEAGLACRITCVQSRDAFAKVIAENAMDVILVDYQLPMYDGMSALRLALTQCPEIPLIFVSGTMGEESAIEALTQGATDYVLKQNLSRLPSAILRALQEAENRRKRRRAEQQVALMGFALNGIHEAAFLIDETAHLHYVNDEACHLLGYSREELFKMNVTAIDPGFSLQRWSHHWNNLQQEGATTFERKLQTRDGRIFPAEINANYFEFEGKSFEFVFLRDITDRKQAEREHEANLKFFESMDKVNRAIQGVDDLEEVLKVSLDVVISIFDCDRAFLLYPCDPDSPTWIAPMERTKPDYPGALDLKMEMPMDPQVAETLRIMLAADGPVAFGPGMPHALPEDVSEEFGIKSFLSMAIYPKTGSPWQFGIHQCTHAREWTPEETKLFEAIGRRFSDGLSTLLSYRDLRKNEKFLDNVVEHIPNMVFVKDAETLSFVRFNRAGEELVGYPREALLGKSDYDLFPKAEADFFTAKDRLVLDSRELVDIPEEPLLNKNNEERILHTKKIPILDETGSPQYLLGISEDITERKQAEEKQLRSDQRLRLHKELSPLGFLEWDENFLAVEWNAACERIFGYTREEAIGRHVKDLILPEAVHKLVDGVFESLMNQTGGEHSINKNITKDGRFIICEWFNTTLVNKDGKAVGVASICHDITEQKKAEESIRKLSQAIEQSPVSIVITDLEGRIEFINTQFTKITGYTFAEALGQNPRILKSGETPAEEYRRLWQTIRSGDIWQGEFHNRKKNGKLFWEHATIAPVRDTDNAITHFVAVKEDITERKKLEAQLLQTQKMEAVGQLAGGVAHDFNNMLGVIIGRTELALGQEGLGDAQRNNLQEILTAGIRSSEITRQLLAFARKQTIQPKVLDLNDTVEGMLKMLRRLIGEDIDLTWLPGAKLWPVKMDPSQVDQILANLSVNARDAIDGVGKITIETQKTVLDDTYCSEHKGYRPGEYVMLAVSDNGSGMDKQTVDKIFEPFFTTKGLGKGTGLGLATIYGIVKQNDGFVNVYSEPGQGSTFKIYLPRHAAETEQKCEKSAPVQLPGGDETILLVEDEAAMLTMVKQMLEKLGYSVLASSSPREALHIAGENPGDIDLLITDLVMPEMTGRELKDNLISFCSGFKYLFMSGYTGNVIAQQKVLEEGVNFIQKPFSEQALAAKVRKVLDGV